MHIPRGVLQDKASHTNVRLLTADARGPGLELAEAHRPALILLDIALPEMDGYAVMQRLLVAAVPMLTLFNRQPGIAGALYVSLGGRMSASAG